MNDKIERLVTLTCEQRNIIKKLLLENRHLQMQNRSLSKRNQDLEERSMVIDREIAEIPIGFDLIPEDDLNRF
jgi:regulator of replication initiation timing